jgi:chitodextrinase
MTNKRFWFGMLVIVLVSGMMIAGCKDKPEEETNPSPPTGLAGSAVSPTSVQLTWNSVSNADEYWIEYKKNPDIIFTHKQGIKSASDTITGLVPATKYDFRVAVKNTDGFASSFSSIISVDTLPPSTASVSLSNLRTTQAGSFYQVIIILKLSEGAYWNSKPIDNTVKSWVTVNNATISSWTFSVNDISEFDKDTLRLGYSSTTPINISSGITVSIDTTKLAEMKGYTNVTDSLTIGSPAFASSSAWTN